MGERIEKYELLMPVARGGMGSVWAAKLHGPHGFEKIVAIKMVLPELAADARVRAMFLEEARIASAISHRNVAHVLDFLEHEGGLYIVMEWVDGTSLVALHDQLSAVGARIPLGIVLRVLADACAGLHAAHELTDADGEACGLVHRDFSPHNVLIAREGSAKLIDFGVAETRFRATKESAPGELRGRLAFMAPEQAQCDSSLDRRADIWSVGATLMYLLTGHGPFGPCEPTATLRHLLGNTAPVAAPPEVLPSVARVLSGCLARRREDRFPTAKHLGWALEEAIEDLTMAASARDVAAFLAERSDGGKAALLKSGRYPVQRGLAISAVDSEPVRHPLKKLASRASSFAWTAAGFACASAISLAVAAANGGLHGPATAAAALSPAPAVAHVTKVETPVKDALTVAPSSAHPPAGTHPGAKPKAHPHLRAR